MNLLQMSISGGVLILMILVLRALFLHRVVKSTFIVLWAMVMLQLLLPFSFPYEKSLYPLINLGMEEMQWGYPDLGEILDQGKASIEEKQGDQKEILPVRNLLSLKSVVRLVWFCGVFLFSVYFCFSYLLWIRKFRVSIRIENEVTEEWLNKHKMNGRIEIRQSGFITSPLTYGLFKPIIMLPKTMDWTKETELEYIFMHEYIHIRRRDFLWKLIVAVCLCLHWFNPLVWLMYSFFQRDMELSCDEEVLKRLGEEGRTGYALTLLSLEEKRAEMMLFGNNFSKHALEERVIAMMKKKRNGFLSRIGAVSLILCGGVVLLVSGCTKESANGGSGKFVEASEKSTLSELEMGNESVEETLVSVDSKVPDIQSEAEVSDVQREETKGDFQEWIWPTVGTEITSTFGERIHPFSGDKKFLDHVGIKGEEGDEVYAATNAVVAETGFDSQRGNYIILQTQENLQLLYGHLKEIVAETGITVCAGDKIATLGKTGMATGSFLSFGVYEEGTAVDPMKYFPNEWLEFMN